MQVSVIGFCLPCALSLAILLARTVRAIGSPAASTINEGICHEQETHHRHRGHRAVGAVGRRLCGCRQAGGRQSCRGDEELLCGQAGLLRRRWQRLLRGRRAARLLREGDEVLRRKPRLLRGRAEVLHRRLEVLR